MLERETSTRRLRVLWGLHPMLGWGGSAALVSHPLPGPRALLPACSSHARTEAQEWANLTAPVLFKTLVKSRPLTSGPKQVTWQTTKSAINTCPLYLLSIFEIHLLFISFSHCCNSGSSPCHLSPGWLQSSPHSAASWLHSFPVHSSHYESM